MKPNVTFTKVLAATSIGIKTRLAALVAAGVGLTGVSQSFRNLDFEEATFVPVPGTYDGQVQIGPALPGWSVSTQAPFVLHNNMFLDSAGVSILDTNASWAEVLQGNFTVLLQGGFSLSWPLERVSVAIAQTAVIPTWASTLLFDSGLPEPRDFEVKVGGQSLPFYALTSYTNNAWLYGLDISGFSGQTAELRFTAYPRPAPGLAINNVYLDDIRFSSTSLGAPPTIMAPPVSQSAHIGAAVDFAVHVIGYPPPACQWFFNSTNVISGATNATLHLANLQPAQSGAYSVVASNVLGAVTSPAATLTVLAIPPTIQVPPQDQTASVGTSAEFSITAAGSPPLAYQWFFNDLPIPGANSPGLYLGNVQLSQAGTYSVRVTNVVGAVTSAPAFLSVIAQPPAIVNSPQSQAVLAGKFANFSVTAEGSLPLTYQWYFNGSAILGATREDLYVTPAQLGASGTYSVTVTNAFGAVSSAPALLQVVSTFRELQAGRVVAWGFNNWGQTTVAGNLTNVIAVAAGAVHTLVLNEDGTVVAWGYNGHGQTNVPSGLRDVIAVAAGSYHSLALKADGSVVAWGDNDLGQSSVPAGLRDVIAVAGGDTIARRSNPMARSLPGAEETASMCRLVWTMLSLSQRDIINAWR